MPDQVPVIEGELDGVRFRTGIPAETSLFLAESLYEYRLGQASLEIDGKPAVWKDFVNWFRDCPDPAVYPSRVRLTGQFGPESFTWVDKVELFSR